MSVLGLGAEFWLGGTQCAEVLAVKPPNLTNETVDTTHHGSGRVRTKMAALADPGNLTVRMHYVPGSPTDDLLLAAVAAGDVETFKAVVNAGGGASEDVTGNCIPLSWEPDDVVIDDKQTALFTVAVTGAITQAASA